MQSHAEVQAQCLDGTIDDGLVVLSPFEQHVGNGRRGDVLVFEVLDDLWMQVLVYEKSPLAPRASLVRPDSRRPIGGYPRSGGVQCLLSTFA